MESDLYRHAGFLRGIARALLREVHAADDVVHDAYAEVLARGGRFSRAYLAATVKHKAFKWLRSRRRVAARERRAARPEAAPTGDPGDLASQAEMQRRVAEAVAALDPLYRNAILLRYYHGLPPKDIAERTGAPLGTVKTRLRRGLQTLRARLDADHGGDTRTWALGLLGPLAAHAPATAAAGASAGLLTAAAVAVVASGVAFVAWQQDPEPAGPPRRLAAVDDEAPRAETPVETARTDQSDERPAAAPTMRWKIEPGTHGIPSPGTKLELVWDMPGRPPMPDARAWIEGDLVVAEGIREESGNAFALTPDRRAAWIRWNLRARRPERPGGWVNEVTFYPLRTVTVRVFERDGGPLAGAPVGTKQGYTPRGDARTDENGVVVFEDLFGRHANVYLTPDDELGTYYHWLGTVDLDAGDGEIVAAVEPLEEFTIQVLYAGTPGLPRRDKLPGIKLYRATPVDLAVDADAARLTFRARRIAPGRPLRATVGFHGHAPVTLDIEGNRAVCEVPLPAAVAGAVLPPADGELRLEIQHKEGSSWRERRDVRVRRGEEDGPPRFEVTGLRPGEYRLFDTLSGRMAGPFELRPGERRELPLFDLSRCTWVAGRVEPAPQPRIRLSYVRVRFDDERGMGGPRPHVDGRVREDGFRVRVPGDRPATLVLESPTLIADPVTVVGPTDAIVIRARDGARAEMQLVLREAPDTKEGIHPIALLRRGGRVVQRLLEIDFETGRATIAGLEPGRYEEIRLRAYTWPTTVLEDVVIRSGTNDLGRVRIARGSKVWIRIRVPEGEGPPRLVVVARSVEDPGEMRQCNPSNMPVVTLPGLGKGRWKLEVRVMQAVRERLGLEREIEVDGRTDVEIEMDLRRR